MSALSSQLAGTVGAGDNVLLLSPADAAVESEACVDLLTPADPVEENVLCVTFGGTPVERCAVWDRHAGAEPGDAAVVDVPTETRCAGGAATARDGPDPSSRFPVESVDSPTDFAELGQRVVDRLSDWNARVDDRQTAVCFDSVTTLLQYVDLDRAFKFLHALTSYFSNADAVAHFHLDPAVHDETTVRTLAELFDVVCEYERGEWTVREP